MNTFFTTCHAHELPSAIALSLKIPGLKIGLIEYSGSVDIDRFNLSNQEILFLDKIMPEGTELLTKKYTANEIKRIAKVLFSNYLIKKFPSTENLIYVSPESYPHYPHSIVGNLPLKDIFLLPKTTRPFEQKDENKILNSGMYSADFWIVKNTTEGRRFLDWWQQKVLAQGYIDPCNGLNADELWLNHVPVLFKNVGILRYKSFLATPIIVKNHRLPLPTLGAYTPDPPLVWLRRPLRRFLLGISSGIDNFLSRVAFFIWKS